MSAIAPSTISTNPSTTSSAENEIDSRCSSGDAQRTHRCSEKTLHPSPCGRAGPRLPTKKPLIRSTEPTLYHPTDSARPIPEPATSPTRMASSPVPPARTPRKDDGEAAGSLPHGS